jgi:hypothetical protein
MLNVSGVHEHTRVRPQPHVVAAAHGDMTVLLDPVGELYFSLSGTGEQIWSMLEENPTISQIVESLSASYAIDAQQVADDVNGFIAQLIERHLVSTD